VRKILAVLVVLATTSPVLAYDFDLGGLPHYVPEQQLTGTIRNFGFSLSGVLPKWEEGFRKFQPGINFDDKFPSGDVAIAGLVTGVSDLGPQGRDLYLVENLMFFETFGYYPTAITVATGGYDAEGTAPGLCIFVAKDNPLTQVTMKQLDGIFGAERVAGLRGFKWTLGAGRSAKDDIRTWGQLGLKGEWADKPIHTYGHGPSGTSAFFQLRVLGNGDKWNPNYREYVETGSKQIGADDPQQLGGLQHMLGDELAHDKYGIAWSIQPQAEKVQGLKAIPVVPNEGGPAIVPSLQSFQERSYPLVRNIYFYLNRKPGAPLDPRLREFIRFVLSREGQDIMQKADKYLPLPPQAARQELEKLN